MNSRKSPWACPRMIILSISIILLICISPNPLYQSIVTNTASSCKFQNRGEVQIQSNPVSVTPIQDPFFLTQIHADTISLDGFSNPAPVIVAVVDTGIDLHHSDLSSILTPGTNLLHSDLPPEDDNGHGTNVAGVLREIVSNKNNARTLIMPIKALDSSGRGSIEKLNEGIRYAVDHGAKIVVLSDGVNQYSSETLDAVNYAESHDVLLVAATGNEGTAVKYPAAYLTVLAVGGASKDGTVYEKSNWGAEVDVLAPWNVYTTAMGGGYTFSEGTSMSAPQVAGVAALIRSKYPQMKAYQIRDLIRQTANHPNPDGWDPHSGFGLINAEEALSRPYQEDMYTSNTTKSTALPLSYSKSTDSEFHGNGPKWFYLDVPYDGTVEFTMQGRNQEISKARLRYEGESDSTGTDYRFMNQRMRIPVHKGRNYIKLQATYNRNHVIPFHLITQFQIYSDPFGDADRMYKAYVLPVGSQVVTGTFDHKDAKDWFLLPVTKSGILHIAVSTDTPRIDLALQIQKENEKPSLIDQMGEGKTESVTIHVFPGNYYMRIQNVISEHPDPVIGEYKMDINFTPKLLDLNEPNELPYEATFVALNTDYPGVLDTESPVHWYSFDVAEKCNFHIQIANVSGQQVVMELFDNRLQPIEVKHNFHDPFLKLDHELMSGTYLVKLSLIQGDPEKTYNLRISNYS